MISFVVPVYNVEQYISDCIDSLLAIRDVVYEIIIVDDGSKDLSIDIVRAYNNSLIKIIYQENAGLAAARNTGLKYSSGDYVVFVDSDDFINAQQLKLLFNELKLHQNADVVTGEFYFYENGNNRLNSFIANSSFVAKGRDVLKLHYRRWSPVAWRSIYRKNFLICNQLYFTESILFEDADWTPRVLCHAKEVVYSPIPFYYYRQRVGSIIKSEYSYEKFENCLFIANHLLDFVEHEIDKEVKEVFQHYSFYQLCVGIGKYCVNHELQTCDRKKILDIMSRMQRCSNIRLRLTIYIYKYFPHFLNMCFKRKYK